ncbi:hypothetical protein FA95DRAFT_1491522 [Auriscalpium vulgare]|uniref:Uncharacterized protein n=1 Tax=Auriscalpium vulgare TaxID=40419 RepID=A0ACB8RVZ1_9AGAM|nr:hypothetical protein FA95DRAFT_1491522 [Auriscalpium vulgare]
MTDEKPPVDNHEYFLRFPPFPTAPPGVTIVSFKDFKPAGIRVPIDGDDDAIEVDGLGIPTIPLRVKHSTDDQEKKKRKKKKTQDIAVHPAKPRTWWEEWEELEDVRKNLYDPRESRVDRLFKAASDFKGGRPWPPAASGLFNLWDQFRLYIGLLQQPVVSRKPDVTVSDDSGSEDAPAGASEPSVRVEERVPPPPNPDGSPQRKKRRFFHGIGAGYNQADEEEDEAGLSFQEKLGNHREEKDIRLENFLNDPETSIKIFFSSYFRDRGLIWSVIRCTSMPILISFFLRYLLRSRVLPEKEHEKPLRRALEVVELARKELPMTFAVGRGMPDAFSDGCQQCWGSKQPDWRDLASLSGEIVEEQNDDKPGDASTWGAAAAEDGTAWGSDWASATLPTMPDPAPSVWEAPLPSLLPLLGATVFPLTHEAGVVEMSTRRIVAVHPPLAPRILAQGAASAEAVEEELERRLARVVLAPWPPPTDAQRSDVTPPTILPASRGAIVVEGEAPPEVPAGALKPHDPYTDEITVLVEAKSAALLTVGMGLGATWVEIVRQKGQDVGKKSKKGKKKERPRYWYMEQLMHQLPSFHAEMPAKIKLP